MGKDLNISCIRCVAFSSTLPHICSCWQLYYIVHKKWSDSLNSCSWYCSGKKKLHICSRLWKVGKRDFQKAASERRDQALKKPQSLGRLISSWILFLLKLFLRLHKMYLLCNSHRLLLKWTVNWMPVWNPLEPLGVSRQLCWVTHARVGKWKLVDPFIAPSHIHLRRKLVWDLLLLAPNGYGAVAWLYLVTPRSLGRQQSRDCASQWNSGGA